MIQCSSSQDEFTPNFVVNRYISVFLQKIEAFEHRMYSHPLHKDSSLESVYAQYQTKAQVSSTYIPHTILVIGVSRNL